MPDHDIDTSMGFFLFAVYENINGENDVTENMKLSLEKRLLKADFPESVTFSSSLINLLKNPFREKVIKLEANVLKVEHNRSLLVIQQ